MFDFDAGKLVVFGIIALAVIPPKDLPRVLRTVGKYVGQARRMAADFQGQLMDAMKEAELDSVKKEIDEIASTKVTADFEPAKIMREHIETAVAESEPAPVAAPPEPAPVALAEPPAEKAASGAT